MVKKQEITPKDQRENLKMISDELAKHSPLIKEILSSSKNHERKMFSKEILFGLAVFVITGLLAFFDKLSGETLAGLIGVIVGYIIANNK